jgi:hypothetical protein
VNTTRHNTTQNNTTQVGQIGNPNARLWTQSYMSESTAPPSRNADFRASDPISRFLRHRAASRRAFHTRQRSVSWCLSPTTHRFRESDAQYHYVRLSSLPPLPINTHTHTVDCPRRNSHSGRLSSTLIGQTEPTPSSISTESQLYPDTHCHF